MVEGVAQLLTDGLLILLAVIPIAAIAVTVIGLRHHRRFAQVLAMIVGAALCLALVAVGGSGQPSSPIDALARLIWVLLHTGIQVSDLLSGPISWRSDTLTLSGVLLATCFVAAILFAFVAARRVRGPDAATARLHGGLWILYGASATAVWWLGRQAGIGVPGWWWWPYALALALLPVAAIVAAIGMANRRQFTAASLSVGLILAVLAVTVVSAGSRPFPFTCEVYQWAAMISCNQPQEIIGCGHLSGSPRDIFTDCRPSPAGVARHDLALFVRPRP